MKKTSSKKQSQLGFDYGEKKLIKLRAKVNEMYFKQGISKNNIVKKVGMSNNFVIKWTKEEGQDPTIDNRGWPRGLRRSWDIQTEQRIEAIHKELTENEESFFSGATAIVNEWRKKYPNEKIPPLRTIGQILADLGLSSKHKKKSTKGAAKYLCYPEHTIYEILGGRVLEADFIGKKYITGRTKPLSFIGFSFKKAPKIRYYKRIEAETASSLIEGYKEFFNKFEKPDYVKVDNGPAMIGSNSAKRTLSRSVKFLLENEIIPIFAVPRKPFSQASIEGNNSIFSRFFWNKIDFKSLAEVEEKLGWFNQSSLEYSSYKRPKSKTNNKDSFIPKVYFIRQVREDQETEKGFIGVVNENILLPRSYINYFVLAEWNLEEEQLLVHFEKDLKQKMIKKLPFKIYEKSKIGSALSSCI